MYACVCTSVYMMHVYVYTGTSMHVSVYMGTLHMCRHVCMCTHVCTSMHVYAAAQVLCI